MTRLLPLLTALPVLCLLSACDSKTAQEAEKEYTSPMAKGIAEMESQMPGRGLESGNVEIMAEQVIGITLQVPSPAWSLKIDEVWVVGQEMWAIVSLSQSDTMAAQVITAAKATATIKNVPKLPVTYYVVGKTFDWEKAGPNVKFIKSKQEIQDGLEAGEQVYPRP